MRLRLDHLTILLVFSASLNLRLLSGVAGLPSFALAEVAAYLAAGLILAAPATRSGRWPASPGSGMQLNWALLAYLCLAGAAAVWGLRESPRTFQVFRDLIPAVIIYFAVTWYCADVAALRRVLVSYLCGALVSLAVAWSQILFGGPYLTPLSENADFKVGLQGMPVEHLAVGLFNHPNGFAVFLIPVVVFCAGGTFLRKSGGRKARVVCAFTLALASGAMAMTYAKGAWIWSAVGVTWLFRLFHSLRWRVTAGVLTVVTVIVGIVVVSLGTFSEDGEVLGTVLSRMQLWAAAVEILSSDSSVRLIGGGFAAMERATGGAGTFSYGNAHNTWLNQALYYGVPAMGAYLCAAVDALRRLSLAIQNSEDGPLRVLSICSFASLLAILGEYFFEPLAEGVVFQSQLFLLLALAAKLHGLALRSPPAAVRLELRGR